MKRQWLVLGIVLLFVASAILGNRLWTACKTRKQAELSIRKLALSINLEKDKQEKITDFEIERLDKLNEAKHDFFKNKKGYIGKAKSINAEYHNKVQPLLDSLQKLKYQKYKAAAARKRISKMNFKKMFGNRKGQKNK